MALGPQSCDGAELILSFLNTKPSQTYGGKGEGLCLLPISWRRDFLGKYDYFSH